MSTIFGAGDNGKEEGQQEPLLSQRSASARHHFDPIKERLNSDKIQMVFSRKQGRISDLAISVLEQENFICRNFISGFGSQASAIPATAP